MDNVIGVSKPRYLCRWWMKTRKVYEYPVNSMFIRDEKGSPCNIMPVHEFYCPWWARPLDFVWKLIFGNPKLTKGVING